MALDCTSMTKKALESIKALETAITPVALAKTTLDGVLSSLSNSPKNLSNKLTNISMDGVDTLLNAAENALAPFITIKCTKSLTNIIHSQAYGFIDDMTDVIKAGLTSQLGGFGTAIGAMNEMENNMITLGIPKWMKDLDDMISCLGTDFVDPSCTVASQLIRKRLNLLADSVGISTDTYIYDSGALTSDLDDDTLADVNEVNDWVDEQTSIAKAKLNTMIETTIVPPQNLSVYYY